MKGQRHIERTSTLVSKMRMEYPHGYHYTIYKLHPTKGLAGLYEDTPFKSYELTETTYDEWKKWWADYKAYGQELPPR